MTLRIWDTRTQLKCAQTLGGYVYFPLSLDVSQDGLYLLTGCKGFNHTGCESKLWDRRTGKVLQEFRGHTQDTVGCCFLPSESPDRSPTHVATASKDRTIKIWDGATGDVVDTLLVDGGMFTCLVSGTWAADSVAGTATGWQKPGSGQRSPCVAYCATTFWGGVYVYDSSHEVIAQRAAVAE